MTGGKSRNKRLALVDVMNAFGQPHKFIRGSHCLGLRFPQPRPGGGGLCRSASIAPFNVSLVAWVALAASSISRACAC